MKKILFSLLSLIIVVSVAFSFSGFSSPQAEAQSSNPKLSGWFWSDNIGWISLSGTNPISYGVEKLNDGSFSGFAWADNLGWIEFRPGFTGPAGNSNGVKATLNVGTNEYDISGWARACAGTVNGDCNSSSRTDGWDGWIAFQGPWSNPSTGQSGTFGTKAVSIPGTEDYKFIGFGWGSDAVGWIDTQEGTLLGVNSGSLSVSLQGKENGVGSYGYYNSISPLTIQLGAGGTGPVYVDLLWQLTSTRNLNEITCTATKISAGGTRTILFSGLANGTLSVSGTSGTIGDGELNDYSIGAIDEVTTFEYSCSTNVGSVLTDSGLFVVYPTTSNCPVGFHWDNIASACVPDFTCPPGETYNPSTGLCESVVVNPSCIPPKIPANPANPGVNCICPVGFEEFGSTCRRPAVIIEL